VHGRLRAVRLGTALLGLLLAAACGGTGGSHPAATSAGSAAPRPSQKITPEPGGTATITIQGAGFGAAQTVNPGEPIYLVNRGATAYTVTSGSSLDVKVAPGATVTFSAPTVPGSYPLSVTQSPAMHGTLNVRGV
jgi:hypothetical protein